MNKSFRGRASKTSVPVSAFAGVCSDSGRESDGPASVLAAGARIDRFEVVRCLGHGGMGVVYLARDLGPIGKGAENRVVAERPPSIALKVLRPELAGHSLAVTHFLKEARHMHRLQHPHILPVLDFAAEGAEWPWLAMPYLEQGSLDKLLIPSQPLRRDLILNVAKQMADALAYAHRRGLIHRDIKPQNILLDGRDHIFLSDFGLARSLFNDPSLDVRSPFVAGTPQYQSPGAARGEHGDTRDDIYAFGAVLYEMLTGRPPYASASPEEILSQVRAGPPPSILKLNPAAPCGLAQIAQGAMAPDLEERYAHMSYIIEDLGRVARDETPLGPHGKFARPASSGVRLKQVWAAALLIGTVVLAAVLLMDKWTPGKALTGKTGAAPAVERGPRLELVKQFHISEMWQRGETRVGYWLSKQEPSLFLVQDGKLLVVSTQGYVVNAYTPLPPFELRSVFVEDVDGDGLDEAVLSGHVDQSPTLSVRNQAFFELKRFTAEGHQRQSPDDAYALSGINWRAVVDLEGDGRREVLADVGTSWPPKPRGLCCFSFEDQQLLWKHHIGP